MQKALSKTCASMMVICAVALGSTAWAEDKSGSNLTEGAEGGQGPVAQLAMAQDLYAYGVENKDAIAVLSAARITGSIGTKDVERDAEDNPIEGAAEVADAEGAEAPVDAAAMFATAKDLAAGDDAVMGLIEDAMAEGSRGRIGGATRTLKRLRAGRTNVFVVPFYGGQLAELAIIGDGDANLDLLVTDENGNTICVDRSYSDKLYCSWTPAGTATS